VSIYKSLNNLDVDVRSINSAFFVMAHLSIYYKNVTEIYATEHGTIYFTFEPENWGSAIYLEVGYSTMGFYSDSGCFDRKVDIVGINDLKSLLIKSIID